MRAFEREWMRSPSSVPQIGVQRAASSIRCPSGSSTNRLIKNLPFTRWLISRIYLELAGKRDDIRVSLAAMDDPPSECDEQCVSGSLGRRGTSDWSILTTFKRLIFPFRHASGG